MATQTKYSEAEIHKRLDGCPKLASLRSIKNALSELVHAEQSFTSQIAEIIRRDPTLTTRLLKLVNSVFFGLSKRVTNIEDAIFYLGLKQIRQLALATPVIEDFNRLNASCPKIDWKLLWQHSIGTAIVTREVLAVSNHSFNDDTDYIVGLVHNVGQIVMASTFTDEFTQIYSTQFQTMAELVNAEREAIGWDHGQIGAYYLRKHQLSEEVVEGVAFHHNPTAAPSFSHLAAAVQVADMMVRSAGITGVENVVPPDEDAWLTSGGWHALFGHDAQEAQFNEASLRHTVARLPSMLRGLV